MSRLEKFAQCGPHWVASFAFALLFLPGYLVLFFERLPPWRGLAFFVEPLSNTLLRWLYLVFLVDLFLLGHEMFYLLGGLVVVGFSLVGLVLYPSRLRSLWSLALAVAIILLPLCFPYHLPLVATAGYEMQVATTPHPFRSFMRGMLSYMELRRCHYEVFGWTEENHLYFQERCFFHTSLWSYAPDATAVAQQVSVLPPDLQAIPRSVEEIVLMVHDPGDGMDRATRPFKVSGRGYTSSDTVWTAIIAKPLTGGPQEVLVLRPQVP
jgi:hypothetical protein